MLTAMISGHFKKYLLHSKPKKTKKALSPKAKNIYFLIVKVDFYIHAFMYFAFGVGRI